MDRIAAIADAFIAARAAGTALDAFPLSQPETLDEAYRIQDREVDAIGAALPGWKIAGVRPDLRAALGAERVAGPITRLVDARSADGAVEVPVVAGGFAAAEAEFVLLLGRDLPPRAEGYAAEDLAAAVAAVHIGAEIAGSPLATLNDLGPTAVVSDHGNNAAIVIGPAIGDWRARPLESLTSRVAIDGATIGEGDAARVAGGPLAAFAFLVANLARRGRGLRAGDWISTGATTGVHVITPGSVATFDFGAAGAFEVRIVAQPRGA